MRFRFSMGCPGFDASPFTTAGLIITKDVETGIRNVGSYVLMKTGKTTGLMAMGLAAHTQQHISLQWFKAKKRGLPLEAALTFGAVPVLGMTAGVKYPYGVDELSVSGGLAGEPIKLVKCETVDLEVPATSEIIMEGEISTEYMERGGFHGEYQGYVTTNPLRPQFKLKCISHRKNPIYVETVVQREPCDAQNVKEFGNNGLLYSRLKYDENIPGLIDVMTQMQFNVFRVKSDNSTPTTVMKIKNFFEEGKDYLTAQDRKFIVIVDEDINLNRMDDIIWAMSGRTAS